MTDRRGPGTKKPRMEAESSVYWKTQADRLRAQLAAEREANKSLRSELKLSMDGERGLMAAVLGAIGGQVEGAPTLPINYLQRLRELTLKEALLAISKTQLATEREAHARTVAEMLREALADMEDACAQVASWSVESIEYSDAVRVAARAALAASPGDWLAARDRALAERVREAVLDKPLDLPKDNAAWCTSCLENVQTAVEVRANALDLDALVGGKS